MSARKKDPCRLLVTVGIWGLIVMTSTVVRADRPSVPEQLQVVLLAKVLAFDRAFVRRTEGMAKVAIVYRPGDTDSVYTAQQLRLALEQSPKLGAVPHQDTLIAYAGARELAPLCERNRMSVVLLSTGFVEEARVIANALASQSLVTTSTIPADVAQGIMVGFELVSGRPLIEIQLDRARAQGVDFSADFIRLVKVIN